MTAVSDLRFWAVNKVWECLYQILQSSISFFRTSQGELGRAVEEKEAIMSQYTRTRNSMQQQIEELKRMLEEESKVFVAINKWQQQFTVIMFTNYVRRRRMHWLTESKELAMIMIYFGNSMKMNKKQKQSYSELCRKQMLKLLNGELNMRPTLSREQRNWRRPSEFLGMGF